MPPERDTPSSADPFVRIGLVGDLHGAFDPVDASQLDAEEYERILFVGDLGPGTLEGDRKVARAIARLRTPVMVMPGNNDCEHAPEIRAELGHQRGLTTLLRQSGASHRSALVGASGDVTFCGYALHPVRVGDVDVTIVSGRPYAMGSSELSFPDALREQFGVDSLAASRDRLVACVDASVTEALVFLAHNGPLGLGASPDAMWGNDFDATSGDHGDSDLRDAIDHAVAIGRRVLGVIAGHMHSPIRGGGLRPWRDRRDGILYLNPARLPRVVPSETGVRRHHVELRLSARRLDAEERWLDDEG